MDYPLTDFSSINLDEIRALIAAVQQRRDAIKTELKQIDAELIYLARLHAFKAFPRQSSSKIECEQMLTVLEAYRELAVSHHNYVRALSAQEFIDNLSHDRSLK